MPWGILLNPTVLLGLAFAGASAWAWIQTERLDSAKTALEAVRGEYGAFKAQVATLGRIAQDKADKQAKSDKRRKEVADANYSSTIAAMHNDLTKLRDERDRSVSSRVPASASSAQHPDRACFNRPELEQALRGLLVEVRGFVDEGSATIMGLDAAKAWAQGRQASP